ncbi:MAG: response regulator [Planctomycetales bacterium]|nr:response regulator [Planctomycetales bacterium]
MNSKKKRILVYIAEPLVLDVTVFRLELLGMAVAGAQTPEDLSDALATALPDAVIIDLDPETPDGMRWVEKIASDEVTSHVPIMCLSSRGDLIEAEQAFKAGARSLLISPYDPVLLEEKLAGMLESTTWQMTETARES